MDGGKLLATGSKSCVFRPSIPCKEFNNKDYNKVSKIVYDNKAALTIENEKYISKLISNIKGFKDWAIIFDQFCDTPVSYNEFKKHDKKGIKDCYDEDKNDFNVLIFNSDYGGETMAETFTSIFKNTSKKKIEHDFIKFMDMMKPLFLGLTKMEDNNIIHNDIKSNNIVEHKGSFKYIDFGLSNKLEITQSFKKRSEEENKTSRIYHYYPLDYLLFYLPKNKLENEALIFQSRKNYGLLNKIYNIFDFDLYNSLSITINDIIHKQINESNMIKSIDVYSLGIQVPLLFYHYSNIKYPHLISIMINDFYELFKGMINPSIKDRLSPKEANQKYTRLLKKYKQSKENKKSRTRTRSPIYSSKKKKNKSYQKKRV